jgi:hypothetical protein
MVNTQKIDGLIASYEKRITTLRSLKSLMDSEPELAQEFVRALMPEGSIQDSGRSTYTPKKNGQYVQMVEFMKDSEWRTVQEIADGIGAAKHSIAPYLYKDDTKDQFECRDHPDKPRLKQWRLKQPEQFGEQIQDNP